MQYREDKRSGNKVSALGMGCMRWPGGVRGVDPKLARELVSRSLELGINYFDAAYLYPGIEEALGGAVEALGMRDELFIATKLPHVRCSTAADFDRLFATSLERLRTSYIDYYLIHNVTSFEQWERVVELGIEDWIAQRKADGSIRQIGFSFHGSNSEFGKVLDSLDWDFVQIQYNYANERYQAGRSGLELAAERGLPVIIMEPLLGGKLAQGLPERTVQAFKATDPNRAPAEWSFRWLWDQEQVTCVLSGMNTVEQIEENARSAAQAHPGCLSIDERATIEVALDEFQATYKVSCTGCNYCMPCPHGINIPACFTAYNQSYALGRMTGIFQYVTGVGGGSSDLHLASDCVRCGACTRKCPQHIQIPDELENVRKRLQPAPLGAGLKAFGKLTSRKHK